MTGRGEPGGEGRPESRSPRPGGKGSPPGPWLSRAPIDRLLAGILRWATRLAALGLLLSLAWREGATGAAAAGVGILLGAPFLATLSAAVAFGRQRRWRLAGAAVLLLLLLGAGAWIGSRGGG